MQYIWDIDYHCVKNGVFLKIPQQSATIINIQKMGQISKSLKLMLRKGVSQQNFSNEKAKKWIKPKREMCGWIDYGLLYKPISTRRKVA